ncbi:MAG: uracil-DNA glycosylase [Promethearchaeota archaeon]|jgi:DNA polymerase
MEIEKIIERNFPCISDEYRDFVLKKDKCRLCSIYEHYKQVGQSEGNAKDPTFMFVGEALGKDEVEQVRPFIGAAGQRLRAELRQYPKTFRRDSVIITNVLACRPLNNKFPGETSLEVKRCTKNWLEQEIKLLKPKVIVTLGNPAMRHIRGDSSITANRGKWKFLYNYRAWSLATYHPSYVIRSERSGKNFVADQFASDIKTVATMWKTMVGDYRMSASAEQFKRDRALAKTIELGLAGQ